MTSCTIMRKAIFQLFVIFLCSVTFFFILDFGFKWKIHLGIYDSFVTLPKLSEVLLLYHNSSVLTWIGTTEGMCNYFEEVESMYSFAYSLGKRLQIVDNMSPHYAISTLNPSGRYSICDMLSLPPLISCVHLVPNIVVKLVPCYFPYSKFWNSEVAESKQHFQDKIRSYGIRYQYRDLVYRNRVFDELSTTCIISRDADAPLLHSNSSINKNNDNNLKIPIRFPTKFLPYFNYALDRLGTTSASEVVAIHWRRGDQLTDRCAGHDPVDTSLNCAHTSSEFILGLQNVTGYSLTLKNTRQLSNAPIIYVSTNEEDDDVLNDLSSVGLKLFRDLNLPNSRLSAADRFVIELILMIDSGTFYSWGYSGVHDFVRLAREQRASLNLTTLITP